jgi:WD40 repeat protein
METLSTPETGAVTLPALAPAAVARRTRRTWLRFSLRTLLLTVLLIGSATTLFKHWEPWYVAVRIEQPNGAYEAHEFFAFSPDSRHFVTVACGGIPRVRDAETGGLEAIRSGQVRSQFSADGRRLLLKDPESDEPRVCVWDFSTHAITQTLNAKAPFSGFFSPDGQLIYLCYFSEDQNPFKDDKQVPRGAKVVAYDASTCKQRFEIGGQPGVGCGQACLSRDGKMLVGIYKNTWSAWDARSGEALRISGQLPKENIGVVSLSPDGSQLLTTSYDAKAKATIRLWQIGGGVVGDGVVVQDGNAEFRPDGQSMLMLSNEKILIKEVPSGKLLFESATTVDDVCQSPDGNTIVTESESLLQIWRRRHPEYWWGVMLLPEFWLTLVLAGGFFWSIRRDWRSVR